MLYRQMSSIAKLVFTQPHLLCIYSFGFIYIAFKVLSVIWSPFHTDCEQKANINQINWNSQNPFGYRRFLTVCESLSVLPLVVGALFRYSFAWSWALLTLLPISIMMWSRLPLLVEKCIGFKFFGSILLLLIWKRFLWALLSIDN